MQIFIRDVKLIGTAICTVVRYSGERLPLPNSLSCYLLNKPYRVICSFMSHSSCPLHNRVANLDSQKDDSSIRAQLG